MNNFLIGYVVGLLGGFLVGWTVFDVLLYKPLSREFRKLLDDWKKFLDNHYKANTVAVKESSERGRVKSPFRVL